MRRAFVLSTPPGGYPAAQEIDGERDAQIRGGGGDGAGPAAAGRSRAHAERFDAAHSRAGRGGGGVAAASGREAAVCCHVM